MTIHLAEISGWLTVTENVVHCRQMVMKVMNYTATGILVNMSKNLQNDQPTSSSIQPLITLRLILNVSNEYTTGVSSCMPCYFLPTK